MVAELRVYTDFGGTADAPGTSQDTTSNSPNVRLKTADDNTIDTNNPIPIPSSGTGRNRSYWKHVYLLCTTAPDTQVDNIKIYSDGTGFGAGIETWVGNETPTKNSGSDAGYDPAKGTAGETGRAVTSHTDVTATTGLFTFTSGSPKDVSISEASSIIDATGETSDYVLMQMAVSSAAASGNLADETITFRYDEI